MRYLGHVAFWGDVRGRGTLTVVCGPVVPPFMPDKRILSSEQAVASVTLVRLILCVWTPYSALIGDPSLTASLVPSKRCKMTDDRLLDWYWTYLQMLRLEKGPLAVPTSGSSLPLSLLRAWSSGDGGRGGIYWGAS